MLTLLFMNGCIAFQKLRIHCKSSHCHQSVCLMCLFVCLRCYIQCRGRPVQRPAWLQFTEESSLPPSSKKLPMHGEQCIECVSPQCKYNLHSQTCTHKHMMRCAELPVHSAPSPSQLPLLHLSSFLLCHCKYAVYSDTGARFTAPKSKCAVVFE